MRGTNHISVHAEKADHDLERPARGLAHVDAVNPGDDGEGDRFRGQRSATGILL
jgi:hypothetical protein